MLKVFIGFDPRESIAFHVFSHSINRHASEPVAITPLKLSQLSEVLWRPREKLQSTDFSFSRFLVPYLSDFEGWSAFFDCDMLLVDDIARLFALCDPQYAVMVVKHEHDPVEDTKFLGNVQSKYAKKNWSSVMLFNNEKCRALTKDYVNTASGLELHQFKWLEDDLLIGALPAEWNHLVDYNPHRPIEELSNLHYTVGGPYFEDYQNCGYADVWRAERELALYAGSITEEE